VAAPGDVGPALPPAATAAQAPKRPVVPTLEGTNRALAEAKLRVEVAPTLENERSLAQLYQNEGVLDAAFDHYRAALRLDPHDVPALDGTARIWRDWGFANVGLPLAYRAVYWGADSAAAQNTLGTLLLKLGHTEAARRRFEAARSMDPASAYPLNNLCYLELQQGRVEDALRLCRDAADADPVSSTVRNNLAMVLATSGHLDAAFSAFASFAPPAVAAYNQGIMLMAARQFDRAFAAFSRARVADPAFRPAVDRLKQLAAVER
jgi:Flp pilus assembly protein TadD